MNEEKLKTTIEDTIVKLLSLAATKLPQEFKDSLKEVYEQEEGAAKAQMKAILDDIEIAETGVPICQDTGVPIFYLEVGDEFPIRSGLKQIIEDTTKIATEEVPLRPNAVEIWEEKNTGNNVGENIPWIEWKLVPGDKLKVTCYPKGGGSTNVATLRLLNPGEGIKGVKKAVIDAMVEADGLACSPNIVGVGIGGGEDIAMKLAKKATLRSLGVRNENPEAAKLEKELKEHLNALEIGPMGLGGKNTVLDVHVNSAARHPASFPVGIVFLCWAARRSEAIIQPDGTVRYTSHEVKGND